MEPQGASSEKRSRHIYFMEDNLLRAISKLHHVQFHFITKVFRIFKVAQGTQQTQRSENASGGTLQEVKNNRKSLNFKAQKVVAVAYRRWPFTLGCNSKALTGKVLVRWFGWVVDRLWEVVAYKRWSHIGVPFDCILFLRVRLVKRTVLKKSPHRALKVRRTFRPGVLQPLPTQSERKTNLDNFQPLRCTLGHKCNCKIQPCLHTFHQQHKCRFSPYIRRYLLIGRYQGQSTKDKYLTVERSFY